MYLGREPPPAAYVTTLAKVPSPFPSRMPTSLVFRLAVAMSSLLSLLKSLTVTQYGRE
jgi:hypothetical protein